MKNRAVSAEFSHDLMITVMRELYPDLEHGRDYLIAHPVEENSSEQIGDPWFMKWKVEGMQQPDPADLKAEFEANEATYRAIFIRRYRDAHLNATDGKANIGDMPQDTKGAALAEKWRVYRQALRDVPQQPGFPLDVDWPDYPG
jgi:hypothetical protein